MTNKNKLTVITVVATAPANYKPRKSTFRFALATEKMTTYSTRHTQMSI